jgi:hypothetical protein
LIVADAERGTNDARDHRSGGIGKLSPPVSMRAPERLTMGAANRMVKYVGMVDQFEAVLADLMSPATASARR